MSLPKNTQSDTKTFIFQVGGIFLGTIILLAVFGFMPGDFSISPSPAVNIPEQNTVPEQEVAYTRGGTVTRTETTENTPQTSTKPIAITIDEIGVKAQILAPSSPRVDVLDEALKQGAVYYPGSGTIEQGNIFLFGHSTNWAIVQNQAYKTFNNLDKLSVGDEITLTGEDGKTYIYSVETVSLVDADTAFVDLSRPGRRLTISTCNTFGQKSERWVVDAVLKGVVS